MSIGGSVSWPRPCPSSCPTSCLKPGSSSPLPLPRRPCLPQSNGGAGDGAGCGEACTGALAGACATALGVGKSGGESRSPPSATVALELFGVDDASRLWFRRSRRAGGCGSGWVAAICWVRPMSKESRRFRLRRSRSRDASWAPFSPSVCSRFRRAARLRPSSSDRKVNGAMDLAVVFLFLTSGVVTN